MFLNAPLWLAGLLPWAALTVWLLRGHRERAPVPFLPLWKWTPLERPARRGFRAPPLALLALIVAMLLAVLAAAGPALRGRGGQITLLVDRGLSMSATGISRPRYVEAAEEFGATLKEAHAPVTVVDLLTGERRETTPGSAAAVVASLPRSASDMAPLVRPAVLAELARGKGRVILLSDRRVDIDDRRLAQVFPAGPLANVGIAAVAAREAPSAQVMVGVRNDSPLTAAELRVVSGGEQSTRRIDLPRAGAGENYFVDLPRLGDSVEATLIVRDDLDADNTAWLAREARPPRVEIRSTLPDAVRRVVDVYSRLKPPTDGSPLLAVVNQAADASAGGAAVVVEPALLPNPVNGEVTIAADPVTAIVNWRDALRGASAASKAPEGWRPLVSAGGRVVVAARDDPARQVWVGFESAEWPRSADFVVFWTNALDWAGGGGQAFVAHPVSRPGEEWKRRGEVPPNTDPAAWPGLFERSDGALRAMNASPPAGTATRPVAAANAEAPSPPFEERRDISRWFCLAAIGCAGVAALTWKSRNGA